MPSSLFTHPTSPNPSFPFLRWKEIRKSLPFSSLPGIPQLTLFCSRQYIPAYILLLTLFSLWVSINYSSHFLVARRFDLRDYENNPTKIESFRP